MPTDPWWNRFMQRYYMPTMAGGATVALGLNIWATVGAWQAGALPGHWLTLMPAYVMGVFLSMYVGWMVISPAYRLVQVASHLNRHREATVLLHEETQTVIGVGRNRPTGMRSMTWEVMVVPNADMQTIIDTVTEADIMGQPLAPETLLPTMPHEMYRFTPTLPLVAHNIFNMPGSNPELLWAGRRSAIALLHMLTTARDVTDESNNPFGDLPGDHPDGLGG